MPRIFEHRTRRMDPAKCFVIMPFDPSFGRVYELLKGVVENYACCVCLRADEIAHRGAITDEVYQQIATSRFLIADITDQNPNVYYELGLAHALGKEVILLVREGSKVPFDVRAIQFLKYSPSREREFTGNLGSYIKTALQTLPGQWATDRVQDGPNLRILRVDYPHGAVVHQPVQIKVLARNFGTEARRAYFSLSFPFGMTDVKIVESDLAEKSVGKRDQAWKGGQVVLDYPIAEAALRVTGETPGWKPMVTHFLTVQAVPIRCGLIQFYVSASSWSDGLRLRGDPAEGPLLDQREEPVYCGVISVE